MFSVYPQSHRGSIHRHLLVLSFLVLVVAASRAEMQSLSTKLKAEDPSSLVEAARERGSAVRGAILFPQQKYGCANCHLSGGKNVLGPDLTRLGKETTDVSLVESMLYPSRTIRKGFELSTVITHAGRNYSGRIVEQTDDKIVLRDTSPERRLVTLSRKSIDQISPSTKSSMPDGLVDLLSDRQQFLDLLRYMMELKAAGPTRQDNPSEMLSPGVSEVKDELQGLVLLDRFQCASCHRNDLVGSPYPAKQAPDLTWAPGRIRPDYVARFIADPQHVKTGSDMPDILGSLDADARRAIAKQITHFLFSKGVTAFEFQKPDPKAAKRGGELFHEVGCVACHSPRDNNGMERLPHSSVSLGTLLQKYDVKGLTSFLENPHAVRPTGRMPNMQLTHWEAIEIASYLLTPTEVREPRNTPIKTFQLDRVLAEKGRQQFERWECGRCHVLGSDRNNGSAANRTYASLAKLNSSKGCLSGMDGIWPRYKLTDSQRNAIRTAMDYWRDESKVLTDNQQIDLTLATFKCIACHRRDDLGGVAADRDQYFHTTNPNLGPQGRLPPRLTEVGAKLKPKWMRQVLVGRRSIRPYIKTRMPQHGAENIGHIVDLFQRVDRLPSIPVTEPANDEQRKLIRNAGHEMAGTSGLNCIACHTFQLKPAATMPAVDLTEMSERLHRDWFFHYMRDPQRLSPRTVMPSFWPGGRAIRKDILDGDPAQQLAALWEYLLDGRQARTPRGLIRKPIELLATDEAVMLRRSYQGIGKRGIGVGYPGQVNLAFDAEQMRVAMVWRGKFADPAGVWMSQGHGTVRPLSREQIRFAAGPELDDATNPWVVDDGRPPNHQFKGYVLDDLRRPAFLYRFEDVDVEDYSIDVRDSETGKFLIRRNLTFSSPRSRSGLVFRVRTKDVMTTGNDGSFQFGKALRIRVGSRAENAQIVQLDDGSELRIPMDLEPGKSKLVLEYEWR